MGNWRKLLVAMRDDPKPVSYTYDQAAKILENLGFECVTQSGTSHRIFRYKGPNGNVVVVGLVDKGHSKLKAYLIRDMIKQLRANGLLPEDRR